MEILFDDFEYNANKLPHFSCKRKIGYITSQYIGISKIKIYHNDMKIDDLLGIYIKICCGGVYDFNVSQLFFTALLTNGKCKIKKKTLTIKLKKIETLYGYEIPWKSIRIYCKDLITIKMVLNIKNKQKSYFTINEKMRYINHIINNDFLAFIEYRDLVVSDTEKKDDNMKQIIRIKCNKYDVCIIPLLDVRIENVNDLQYIIAKKQYDLSKHDSVLPYDDHIYFGIDMIKNI